MKKLSKKVLEARMQDILNEPTPADFERFETMKERVYAECVRRSDSEEVVPAKHTANKRGYRHYAMAAVVMAIAFIFVPVIYTALFPVTVSNANNVMRRAGVWINNALRLGIEFPEPIDDDNYIGAPKQVGTYTFQTMSELASFIGENVLALDSTLPGLVLNSISVTVPESKLTQINLDYTFNDQHIALTYENIVSDVALVPHVDATELLTPAGTLFYWSTEAMHRATGIISTWSIQLKANADLSESFDIFTTLHFIN